MIVFRAGSSDPNVAEAYRAADHLRRHEVDAEIDFVREMGAWRFRMTSGRGELNVMVAATQFEYAIYDVGEMLLGKCKRELWAGAKP